MNDFIHSGIVTSCVSGRGNILHSAGSTTDLKFYTHIKDYHISDEIEGQRSPRSKCKKSSF